MKCRFIFQDILIAIIILTSTVLYSCQSDTKLDDVSKFSYKIESGDPRQNIIFYTGTGMICEIDNQIFLVTNYHVLTGINPISNKQFSPIKLNQIALKFLNSEKPVFNGMFIKLYDHLGKALFSTYRDEKGQLLDIAVYRLRKESIPKQSVTHFIPESEIDTANVVSFGEDLIVAGYPTQYSLNPFDPVIISTKSMEKVHKIFSSQHYMFLKDPTAPGMSGSPVYRVDSVSGENKLIAINALEFTSPTDPKTYDSGGAVYIKYALELMREMIRLDTFRVDLQKK